jgi:RNA polymerase sigma factor (sigma-70 family)
LLPRTVTKEADVNSVETMNVQIDSERYLDETALVMAAKAGEEEAFTALILRYRGRILAAAMRITNNHADAEDVFQTASMQAYVHLCRFDCRSKFSTWMMRIATNTALMLLRKKRAARTALTDDLSGFDASHLKDPKADVWAELLGRERAWHLEKATRALQPRLRAVLELQSRQQGSIQHTAELSGLSVPATKSRLFRARRELRRQMQACL